MESSSDNQDVLLAKNLALLCSTELHVAWESRRNLGLDSRDLELLYNKQIMVSMNYLISNTYHKEAIQVAKFIKSFDFINKLFVNLGIDFAIEDFVEDWGNSYLHSLVTHSCNTIVQSTDQGQYFKVRSLSLSLIL